MTLSEKICYCRKKAMLSQEVLAEKLGVSRQAVSKWETGESAPELNKMLPLAEALNTSVDWLLSPDDPAQEPEAAPQTDNKGTHPDWLNKLPGFLRKMIYQYGWLFGVRLSVSGALFAGLGLLAQYISNLMLTNFKNTALGFGGIYEEFGGSFGLFDSNPVTGMIDSMTANDPVTIMGKFITFLGLILIVAGVVLAVILKRYGKGK